MSHKSLGVAQRPERAERADHAPALGPLPNRQMPWRCGHRAAVPQMSDRRRVTRSLRSPTKCSSAAMRSAWSWVWIALTADSISATSGPTSSSASRPAPGPAEITGHSRLHQIGSGLQLRKVERHESRATPVRPTRRRRPPRSASVHHRSAGWPARREARHLRRDHREDVPDSTEDRTVRASSPARPRTASGATKGDRPTRVATARSLRQPGLVAAMDYRWL